MNIEDAIKYGMDNLKEKDNPKNLSERLLKNLLNKDRQYLIINDKQILEEYIELEYINRVNKLKKGLPIQYITKKQNFMGLEIYVDENVLIPQPDTETLVEEAIKIIKKEKFKEVLDLCTGSGAIGVSIAKYINDINVTMTDISNDAILIAKKNSKDNFVLNRCKFIKSDLFENINEQYDIIVSNPPYIETETIKTLSKEVQNEPILALDGGLDGLDFYRKIILNVDKYLKNNGYLILEIGYNQKEKIEEIVKESNIFNQICFKKDLQNIDRIVILKK